MAAPPRPWTPTELPGDEQYMLPVVYHGDHQVREDRSSISSDDEPALVFPKQRGEKAVAESSDTIPQPLRFRSSQALRDDAAAQAPELTTYQPYRGSTTSDSQSSESIHQLRPQRSNQALGAGRDQSPNPYRLSQTLRVSGTENTPNLEPPQESSKQIEPRDDRLPANNPYRLSQTAKSESSEIQNGNPERLAGLDRAISSESVNSTKPRRLSQNPVIKADDDLPSVTGNSTRQVNILLINPNATKSMTQRCLESISSNLPLNVTVYGFTASRPAPTAIESQTDAVMSTAACVKPILAMAAKYDGFLVACFSHHPLIAALREQLMQPVIGIMEASIYAARMCGSKFGIVTTGVRSMYLHDASVKNVYGLDVFSAGTESSRMSVLDLESRPREEAQGKLAMAARKLQLRGADCICLGCAGMSDLQDACKTAVGMPDRMAMVIDGVGIGVQFLIGLVQENLGTAKGGVYSNNSGNKALKS